MFSHLRPIWPFALVSWHVGWTQSVTPHEDMMERIESEHDARVEEKIQRHIDLMTNAAGQPTVEAFDGADLPVPTRPPSSKQIAVQRARAFMEEVVAALDKQPARLEIDAARASVSSELPRATFDEDDEDGLAQASGRGDGMATSLLMAVGPLVDKFTKDIVLRYGFEGGFEQALNSVSEAMKRRGDRDLKAGMEVVAEIFAPVRPGRVPALHGLAKLFIELNASSRDAAISKAETMHKGANNQLQAGIGEYLAAMQGIVARGDSYVQDRIVQLVTNARETEKSDSRQLTEEERDLFDMQVETLMDFLPASSQRELEARVGPAVSSTTEL